MKSIRQYLLTGLFVTLLLSSFASFIISYLTTTEEIGELHDAQLIENARFVEGFLNQPPSRLNLKHINEALSQVKSVNLPDGATYNPDGHAYERKVAIQVWTSDGKLLLSTPSAPEYALSPLRKGFFQHKSGKHLWYIYTHQVPANHYWLMVGERSDIREEMLTNILLSMLSGTVLAIVLIVILIGRVIKQGLSPLTNLSRAIQERDLDYLQPVKLSESPPSEMRPVLLALNHLLTRLDEGIERERQFLADAAHELRTPLAVLKLQLQVARQGQNLEQIHGGIDKALQGVNRSTHVVEQLLTLARLESNPAALKREKFDLVGLAQEIIASLAPVALGKLQNLALVFQSEPLHYEGNRVLLGILLRNLIENAIHYSPVSGEIIVTLAQQPEQMVLRVQDNGNGVPEEEIPLLMQRFYRHGQNADNAGTGLGLSIVQKILALHQGAIAIRNRSQGGLLVEISLPVLLQVEHKDSALS